MKLVFIIVLFFVFTNANDFSNKDIQPKLWTFNAERDVKFYLYTKFNRLIPQIIYLNDPESLQNSLFNDSYKTIFVIHGYFGNNFVLLKDIKNAYVFSSRQINVIMVDWNLGSLTINYSTAFARAKSVAKTLAKFIDFLVAESETTTDQISIVGHSMGAHIGGIAAKNVTSGVLNTIVGLDPAAALYSYNKPSERIALTDANYVEIIHTNTARLGMREAIGNADFYCNGGSTQPMCLFDFTGLCSHSMAVLFYAESIVSKKGFWGRTSNNEWETMGGEPSNQGRNVSGVYQVTTNFLPPFAKGP